MTSSKIYLIPSFLHESATQTIPAYVTDAVRQCQCFFVENERSARRFLKQLWKEMAIDDYQWFTIHKAEEAVQQEFKKVLAQNKNIGIISEAGCPGIADPGQLLIGVAQVAGATVVPLVGPSSILLALMASGMNGQQFRFNGYLPIDTAQRTKALKDLESSSIRQNCTEVFIETPYRNNQLVETILKTLHPNTRLCIAADLTAPTEFVRTKTISEWKKQVPDLHKRPVIFCFQG
ncbi:SAM-dependent methyltransferase [Pseudobacter ginsenosidimutans]|uniref:16S rRNA (Cytidine1402-2'-O)-methyltransferase n=1 Tax=Pseudobacter ginsenosidimutans TaxID=661488 RepID=A0A4V2F156_9BACT|nr:SAM-dependent methyltransferase [Pseudobacter ginsenosidimutans]QEC40809.1 SAM-dependent methyltransferase [Pseudobacter ginsenosidimutans]RZS72461.1 16S rRNA (cytidine1402-2'-O)-methyltransferase [Pseudobacter ginsenosidimutans]